jgi:hypothetical protein
LLGSLYKARTQSTPPFQTAGAIFGGDLDLLSVKAVMRKLSRGVVRRGRASSTKSSVMGAAASLRGQGKAKKGECAAPICRRQHRWSAAGHRSAPTSAVKCVHGCCFAGLSEACLRALEALQQDWIARELQKSQPAA